MADADDPKHPAERAGTEYLVFGTAMAGVGVALMAAGASPPGIIFLSVGAALLPAGVRARLAGPMAMRINRSQNALRLGRFDDARALLDDAESRFARRIFRRPLLMQRAELALHDGRSDQALALAEQASQVPLGRVSREFARMQRDEARSWVALLRAGRGDGPGARAAMADAISDAASASARARVVVAELLLLSRSGDRAGLRQTLEANRPLLFEATAPHERALVRGLERMLVETRPLPYREPGKPTERGASATVAAWVAELAPEVAGYVVDRHLAEGPTAAMRFEAPTPEAQQRVDRDRRARVASAANPSGARVAAGVGLGGLFAVAMVLALGGHANVPGRSVETGSLIVWGSLHVAAACLVTLVVTVVMSARSVKASLRALRESALAIFTGDHARARALLVPLLRSSQWSYHATAALNLACVDEREGDFAKALPRCDEALALCSGTGRRLAAYDFLLPMIHAERAFLLAGLGRLDESVAEVSRLAKEFPAYALRGAAELRVKVAQLVQRGDLAGAAQLGRERSVHLQLQRRDELLLDVLDAVDRPTDEDARARLSRQIMGDPHLRAWFDQVAPSLVDRLRKGAAAPQAHERARAPSPWDEEADDEEAAPPSPRRQALRS